MTITNHFEERLLERTSFKIGTLRKEVQLGLYKVIQGEDIRKYPYLLMKSIKTDTNKFIYFKSLNLVCPIVNNSLITCYVQKLKRKHIAKEFIM